MFIWSKRYTNKRAADEIPNASKTIIIFRWIFKKDKPSQLVYFVGVYKTWNICAFHKQATASTFYNQTFQNSRLRELVNDLFKLLQHPHSTQPSHEMLRMHSATTDQWENFMSLSRASALRKYAVSQYLRPIIDVNATEVTGRQTSFR